jgi:hypothetical protein
LPNFALLNKMIMKKYIVLILVVGLMLPIIISCEKSAKKTSKVAPVDTVEVELSATKVETDEVVQDKKVEKKEQPEVKKEEPKQEVPEKVEVPQEIGASPDAVYSLDDNETESSPKYLDGEKKLKKLLKKQLRKGQKGEKARFKASIVIKKDGTVGRVQFTECGYNDDYKPEIIAVLQSLTGFTPGMKNGVAVDSWYYLNYKR